MFGRKRKKTEEQNERVRKTASYERDNSFDRLCSSCQETGGYKSFLPENVNIPTRTSCACGETKKLSCDWSRSDHVKCEKCTQIQYPFMASEEYSFAKEWSFVYYNGIEEKGIVWYKKARDKIIRKIQQHAKAKKKKDKLRKNTIIKTIEGWK